MRTEKKPPATAQTMPVMRNCFEITLWSVLKIYLVRKDFFSIIIMPGDKEPAICRPGMLTGDLSHRPKKYSPIGKKFYSERFPYICAK